MLEVGIPFNTVAQHPQFHRRCGAESEFHKKREAELFAQIGEPVVEASCLPSVSH